MRQWFKNRSGDLVLILFCAASMAMVVCARVPLEPPVKNARTKCCSCGPHCTCGPNCPCPAPICAGTCTCTGSSSLPPKDTSEPPMASSAAGHHGAEKRNP
jgi:hypothetical protein